jgi:CubicO group peptidase (beta-lactamase class C family)
MTEERVHTTDSDGVRLIDAVRGHLPAVIAKHQTPGLSIAIADKGKLIWEAGFGWSDIASGEPITPDSVYHSGSLGKTYTATAVMILVDRGLISLDDPINLHLPFRVNNPLGAREITVLDLMVHRAGLSSDGAACDWAPGDSLADDIAAEYAREWSPMYGGKLIKRWINPVGEAWTYSNLGVATLGLIVETANGEGLTFSVFVQRYIMDPLGMTHSCYPRAQHPSFVSSGIWSKATTGYSRMGGADIPTMSVYLREYPAGGVLGRPADHIRLLLAMMRGGELDGYRLFSPEIARAMILPATDLHLVSTNFGNPKAPGVAAGEQGLIWRLNDRDRHWGFFGHAGGHMFGWRTQCRAWPHYGAALTVATTQWSLPDDSMDVEEVTEFVGTWLRYRQPRIVSTLTSAAISYARGALLAGAYRVTFGIPGDIPRGGLDRIVMGTRDRGGDWDPDAFRRGFEAISALPPSLDAIHAFWESDTSEIDTDTARAAYAALGGRKAGSFLWSLLPPEPEEDQ